MQFNFHFFGWALMKLFYTPNFFPSHITGSTKTLIDNIFSAISNNLLNKTPPANLTRTFSDHLPQALLVPGFYQYENNVPLRKTRKWELRFKGKPWITCGLQKSIGIKNKLFGKFIKCINTITKEKLHNDYKSNRSQCCK